MWGNNLNPSLFKLASESIERSENACWCRWLRIRTVYESITDETIT
jgi:hypothetical protein